MSEEGFLRRWARRKTETNLGIEPVPEPAAQSAAEPVAPPLPPAVPAPVTQAVATEPVLLPTMDDVARLTGESDFSAFVARGVDQAVRRSALKKLFADPHFNVMDKLDMYMDDYNVASPMPEGMLASLKHSKSFFDQAAEDARKRAEAEAKAEAEAAAGSALAAPLPHASEPGAEEAPHAVHAETIEPVPAEADAEPSVLLATAAMPTVAQAYAETAIIMQKQP
jgi:hypothetical protein